MPRVPDDVRVYAIGDVHGCDAEFAALLAQIDADHTRRTPKRQIIILLGDLVDRGPDSAAVVTRATELLADDPQARAVAGNHEEMLLGACAGEAQALRLFARNGGRETALSYGIDHETYEAADFDELHRLLDAVVPAPHRAFMSAMEEAVVIGDYAFVHAGIRPGVPIADQRGEDLRWIRGAFLNSGETHEKFIVHGHTITETVDERPNRLGIDTGAYATGRLTAVALEAERRWFLTT
ncbi:MAG: metallophosphoesterase family protein [Pseudomonadota bacterium]